MKAIYVFDDAISKNVDKKDYFHGIKKKVLMQIDAFRNLGVDISLWSPQTEKGLPKWRKALGLIPGFPLHTIWKFNPSEFADLDFIYIRKSFIDYFFIRFLKKMRMNNPTTKIILELPTYPYDQEFIGHVRQLQLRKEKRWRNELQGLVDYIVTFSEDEQIFGVPTIRTQNGIDVESIPLRKEDGTQRNFTMIAVGVFSVWHGFDRVIEGIHQLNQTDESKNTNLLLVGDGPEFDSYARLIRDYGLEEQVILTGKKSGVELDSLFNQADFAIASLGIHRIGLSQVSTLKAREYCARGIPFVKSYVDLAFSEDFAYCFDIPADDSPVDIRELMTYSLNIPSPSLTPEVMRSYAIKNLSWEVQLEKVIDIIS